MANKGYNININASKMGGVVITTAKGNRALMLPLDGETVREYEGKGYISASVWVSDEADQYGNHIGIQARLSKAQTEAKEKAPYIGNGKQFYPKTDAQAASPQPQSSQAMTTKEDDLPF